MTHEQSYILLAFCARAQGHALQYEQLARQAGQFPAWDGIATQAEAHGLGPLLYTHLQAAEVSLPPLVKRELQGLYLRHREANRVRTRVLAEILTAFQAVDIQVLALKGAALAHLVYPEPGLRPMRDLDLLVSLAEARQAQTILIELGFATSLPSPSQPLPAKHLPVATRRVAGLSVSVEIHHNLFTRGAATTELEHLLPTAISFNLDGVTAYTLGYEEMLWHIYRHMRIIFGPLRLIWVADMVSLAERFAAEIDWQRVRQRYSPTLPTLALFHGLTPLSEKLLKVAPLKIERAPQILEGEFRGWPRFAVAAQRRKGYWAVIRDTFYPSEGWLRLYYGLGPGPSLWWGRWVRHPLHILGWALDYVVRRGKDGFIKKSATSSRLSAGAD